MPRTSSPAEKARPVPVTMATRSSSSSTSARTASRSSPRILAFHAFITSGRLSVRTLMGPC